jgi:DNA-binding transcriptional LysR family regulator
LIARKYLYLIALAHAHHFGRAAAACHVSPSTLSTAIRELEQELGVVLVERGKSFVRLTAEGECVVAHARRAAAGAEALRQSLEELRGGLGGHLRLGVIPTALSVVASLTSPFALRHPRVDIDVRSASTQSILTALRDFELEAAILYVESATAPDLHCLPLWVEDLVFITRDEGVSPQDDSIAWRDATAAPLCLLSRDMHHRQTVDRVFAELGCTPRVSLETNSLTSILAHVRAGPWNGILPRSVITLIGAADGLRVLRLVSPGVEWRTGLVTLARDPQPPLTAALLEIAAELRP